MEFVEMTNFDPAQIVGIWCGSEGVRMAATSLAAVDEQCAPGGMYIHDSLCHEARGSVKLSR